MTDTTPLSPDDLNAYLAALSDPYCRATITHFKTQSITTTTLEILAADLLAFESIHTTHEKTASHLHHAALTQLHTLDVISYDPTTHKITYNGHEHIEALIDRINTIS